MSIPYIKASYDDERVKTPTEAHVLFVLAEMADDDGKCWAGMSTIACKCRMSVRTVIRAIHSLEKAGVVKIDRVPGKSHTYHLMMNVEPYRNMPDGDSESGANVDMDLQVYHQEQQYRASQHTTQDHNTYDTGSYVRAYNIRSTVIGSGSNPFSPPFLPPPSPSPYTPSLTPPYNPPPLNNNYSRHFFTIASQSDVFAEDAEVGAYAEVEKAIEGGVVVEANGSGGSSRLEEIENGAVLNAIRKVSGESNRSAKRKVVQADLFESMSSNARSGGEVSPSANNSLSPSSMPLTNQQYIAPPCEETSKKKYLEDEIVRRWNELADRYALPKVRKLSDARKRSIRKHGEEILELWDEIVEHVERSSFLRGERKGWRMNFDFLLRPSSRLKVIEGVYDDPEYARAGSTKVEDLIEKYGRFGIHAERMMERDMIPEGLRKQVCLELAKREAEKRRMP